MAIESNLSPKGKRPVMFVEDDKAIRHLYQGIAEDLGLPWISCDSPEFAVEALGENRRVRGVIIDNNFNNGSSQTGVELAASLRAERLVSPRTALVLATASDLKMEAIRGKGLNGYIVKPSEIGIYEAAMNLMPILAIPQAQWIQQFVRSGHLSLYSGSSDNIIFTGQQMVFLADRYDERRQQRVMRKRSH